MGYTWEEYENDKGNILRSENPAWQQAEEEKGRYLNELSDFGDELIEAGNKLKAACDREDTQEVESILEDIINGNVMTWALDNIREIESIQRYQDEL